MPRVAVSRYKPKVIFRRHAIIPEAMTEVGATAGAFQKIQDRAIEEVSDDDDGNFHSAASPTSTIPDVPLRFLAIPSLVDSLSTETSIIQDETVTECLPFISCTNPEQDHFNSAGLPHLRRQQHVRFLHGVLGTYSKHYVGYDASRPWLLYWALTGLSLLGEDVSTYRDRCVPAVSWPY